MIRKAKNSDLNNCKKIISLCFDNSVNINLKGKEFFKKTYLEPKYLKEKKDNYDLYVYEKSNKVIGMGLFEEGWIKKIFIHPDYQGKGIGGEIFDKLEYLGIKRGYKKFKAYCFPNSVSFAKKKGFRKIKKVFFKKKGYKLSATYMEKDL